MHLVVAPTHRRFLEWLHDNQLLRTRFRYCAKPEGLLGYKGEVIVLSTAVPAGIMLMLYPADIMLTLYERERLGDITVISGEKFLERLEGQKNIKDKLEDRNG